jgi:multidrug resistance efflux pump
MAESVDRREKVMKNRRFGILAIIIMVIVTIGLAIFGPTFFRQGGGSKSQRQAQMTAHTLTIAKGVVESEEEVEISSQVSGIIAKMRVEEGDVVNKGQPLVMLDSSKIFAKMKKSEAALDEARARLTELEAGYRAEEIEMAQSNVNRATAVYEKAKDDYERQNRLYKKDATTLVELQNAEEKMKVAAAQLSESKADLQKRLTGVRKEEIEQARSAVDSASSELKYYNLLLKDYTISSPIDGVVVERYKDADETVEAGTPILKIVNPDKLRIKAELEETDVGKATEGQPVEVSTDAYKSKVYRGKVYRILPVVKRRSQRTFDPMASFDINTQDIYIHLDNFTGLKNGMSVTVRFMQ